MDHVPAADPPRGLGCMRLSTEPDRDESRAIGVLHAAFDAGITLLDTADAYCLDATDAGHNERLIARALASWSGDRSRIRVATKGGLTRPQGGWVPDGRARHLASACEASLRALGVDRLPLYQLHVVDPRTSLATSVRALDALKRDGLADAIGLCNVTVGQIEEARRITDVVSVQVEVSVWQDTNLLNGVVAYCAAHGIRLLAYRPVGGLQRRRRTLADRLLTELAADHGATPFDIALAWLADLSASITPLPGATQIETVGAIARAATIRLTDADRARLDERFTAGATFRRRDQASTTRPTSVRDGEIVLIMGLPGAGKSTAAEALVTQGYARLNRDDAGGSLDGLLSDLDEQIDGGASRVVLDNTYVSRGSRAAVLQRASRHGLAVRCLWMATPIEDAQVNAVSRIVSRYGRLLSPEEMTRPRKRDVAAFGPSVLFRYQRELEPPQTSEGFSRVDVVPFARHADPSSTNKAIIVWLDGLLWRSRTGQRVPSSADDVEVLLERGDVLRRYQADGWRILGMSWQPELATESQNAATVAAAIARMNALLDLPIEVEYCPHAAGPPICWCRKPLPGLGVLFIHRHRLDPSQCVYVGVGAQDPGFARRLGFQYRDADEFFAR